MGLNILLLHSLLPLGDIGLKPCQQFLATWAQKRLILHSLLSVFNMGLKLCTSCDSSTRTSLNEHHMLNADGHLRTLLEAEVSYSQPPGPKRATTHAVHVASMFGRRG